MINVITRIYISISIPKHVPRYLNSTYASGKKQNLYLLVLWQGLRGNVRALNIFQVTHKALNNFF